MKNFNINDGHWTMEQFRENVTIKQWREYLLNHDNHIIVCGRLRELKAKSLGAGVYQISKAPLKD